MCRSRLPSESMCFLYKFRGMAQHCCLWQLTVLKAHHQIPVLFIRMWDVPSTLRARGDWLFTQTRKAPVFQISSWFPFPLGFGAPSFDRTPGLLSHGIPRVSGDFVTNKLWDNAYLKYWSDQWVKLFWELRQPLAPWLWGAVLLPSSAPSQVASGIIGLWRFQAAPQLLKAVTQSCTEWGERRHCCNDFGAEVGVVRLGHDAPDDGGKRSSDGENNFFTPVSFNKP